MDFRHFLQGQPRKLIFFGGKGGVGKTTCAVSYAWHCALFHPDASFLLVSTDPAHSVKDSINAVPLPANVHIEELDAARALATFKEHNREKLQVIASRGTFFDASDIDQILELSLPGLDELMGFLEISRWMDSDQYETVIVDTAPTGHTLRLLDMPVLMGGWLDALDVLLAKYRYMKKLFQGTYTGDTIDTFLLDLSHAVTTMEKRLTNTQECLFVPVFLAEPLSLVETHFLLSRLKKSTIPVTDLIVNRIYPLTDCPFCAGEHRKQMRCLSEFSQTNAGLTLWAAPLYAQEILGDALVTTFWQGIVPVILEKEDTAAPSPEEPRPLTVEHPAPFPSESIRLLIFAGKGGVGKTTLACATACGFAQQKKRQVLIFSTDPAHSLSPCFNIPIGPTPVRLSAHLSAIEMDASKEFDALKKAYEDELENFLTNVASSLDLSFDRQVMEQLMELAPPGLDEVMALNKAMDFFSSGRYDVLILDSAPTGHLLRLLQAPEVMNQWLKVLFTLLLKYKNFFRLPDLSEKLIALSKSLKVLRRLMSDPEKSAIYAVSILNQMAYEETGDLLAACRAMKINVSVVFLNMATPPSACPLCAAVHSREQAINVRFSAAYPDLIQPVIYRNEMEIQGMTRLGKLAAAMYAPPAGT